MALIDRITDVNRRLAGRAYYPLWVNGKRVGQVDTQFLPALPRELFTVDAAAQCVTCDFQPKQRPTFEAAVAAFFRDYFTRHDIAGWRDERYPVAACFADAPEFLIERAALSYLGITGHGVHVNGYVETPSGIAMWIAKRALTKSTAPGKLDQVVAGGIPYGVSPLGNVIKECEEEASIPAALAKTARPVSSISYACDLAVGLRPDVIFNYDLRLPDDFTPTINDDEVDSFELMPMDAVLDRIANTQDFKCNSAVVVIDFAIRHGLITPDMPDYVALCRGMHVIE